MAFALVVGAACGSAEEPAEQPTTAPAATTAPAPTEAPAPTATQDSSAAAAQPEPEAADGPVLAAVSGKQGGVINMVNYGDVELFDVHAAGTLQSSQFRSPLHNQLVYFDPTNTSETGGGLGQELDTVRGQFQVHLRHS